MAIVATRCDNADVDQRPEEIFQDALCDESLIGTRWEQRRWLRLIPAEYVEWTARGYVAGGLSQRSSASFDKRIAEVQLRSLIAAAFESTVGTELAEVALSLRHRELKAMFDTWGTFDQLLVEQSRTTSESVNDAPLERLKSAHAPAIAHLTNFVVMLLLADELAGDYTDPRLAAG